jgi:hypothetical protein
VYESGAERLAVDERHDVIRKAVRLARLVHGDDVWVTELREQLNLRSESIGIDGGGHFVVQHLHRDSAA